MQVWTRNPTAMLPKETCRSLKRSKLFKLLQPWFQHVGSSVQLSWRLIIHNSLGDVAGYPPGDRGGGKLRSLLWQASMRAMICSVPCLSRYTLSEFRSGPLVLYAVISVTLRCAKRLLQTTRRLKLRDCVVLSFYLPIPEAAAICR